MGFGEILYTILIKPLQILFEIIYMFANSLINNPGLSVIALSITMNFLVLPLYKRADTLQEEERDIEARLQRGVSHIKKTFKGDERMMILSTYYRQNNYKPTDIFKGSISLFLEIPFFIAAYQFLSHLSLFERVAFGPITDLSQPDGLILIGGFTINILPIIMTAVNLISCLIFTKGYPLKTKLQLYGMAIFFFFFLYGSPSGLVFYWTLNNVFSLVKTIFYKLKNPKIIVKYMFAIAGVFIIGFAFKSVAVVGIINKFLMVVGGFIMIVPLIVELIPDANTLLDKILNKSSQKVFFLSSVYLTILTGLVIPSSVMAASPQEFVDTTLFLHPIWYLASSFCLAFGMFIIWCNVFYYLADQKARKVFEFVGWSFCGLATIDYMFFGKSFGNLSSNLTYSAGMMYSKKELLLNTIVVIAIVVAFYCIYKWISKFIPQIISIASIAFIVMGSVNVNAINQSVEKMEAQITSDNLSIDFPSYTLSKNGQNVVVIMIDRSLSIFMPYIFNEISDLAERYDGFTYYSNTVSFGGYTNIGSPALWGGYDYTPENINLRSEMTLGEKQNEALMVMPKLFSENGFYTTVFDPVYANYQWLPDISIYDNYPNIHAYDTIGKFIDDGERKLRQDNLKRNFFCYSFMKISPSIVQAVMYNQGDYWRAKSSKYAEGQTLDGLYIAHGMDPESMNAYSFVENLDDICKFEENGNTFLMCVSNTAHEPMLYQEPEYLPSIHVDNTDYEEEHEDRYTLDGYTINHETRLQVTNYQANAASLLQIANWLDFLRANDVYDNTRIILVADHGTNIGNMPNSDLPTNSNVPEGANSISSYYPTLMVKDFNSTGFNVSKEFMTNGDVPTIAFESLIDNPVNPFTGNVINSDEKNAHDQYVFATDNWSILDNNGNTFSPGTWYSVHDNMLDVNNWTLLNTNAILPEK